jgi:hypothetical protein
LARRRLESLKCECERATRRAITARRVQRATNGSSLGRPRLVQPINTMLEVLGSFEDEEPRTNRPNTWLLRLERYAALAASTYIRLGASSLVMANRPPEHLAPHVARASR